MREDAARALLETEVPGNFGRFVGRWLHRGRRLLGHHRYDDYRLERVQGLRFIVLPSVSNPKLLRTGAMFAELLDERVVPRNGTVLDMGTGSGVCAVFAARHAAKVVAVDINRSAVRCASINAQLNGLDERIEVLHGDLFAPLAARRFDLVLFNPPFMFGVPKDDRDAAWRSNDAAVRFAAGLGAHLAPGGSALLLLSTWGDACGAFLAELAARGFELSVVTRRRYINETVTIVRAVPGGGAPA
jgi:HemK-related putative methylase